MIYMCQWEGVTVCNQTLRWQRQRPNQYHCFWKAVCEETSIFLQNPTPTPSPCGWGNMRIFFLQNCSALVWTWTSRNILAIAHKTKNSQCKDCAGGCSRWPISSFPNCSTSLELQVWTWRETLHPSLTSTFSLSRPAWNTDSLPILYCNVALLLVLTLNEPGVEKMWL